MNKGDFILDGSPQDVRATLIAYITKTLSSEERERFERRVLEDDFFSRQIEEAQFALVEEYLTGSLPQPLHHDVAAWVASSEHWTRHAEITRSLVKLSSSSRSRHTFRRVLVGIAAVVCVAAGIASSWLHLRKPGSAVQTVAKVEVSSENSPTHPPDTVLLVAERLRSAEPVDRKPLVYRVHSGVPVRLQVILPASHTNPHYAVAIRQNGTGIVMNFSEATVRGPAQAPFLELILPPNTLKAGEYAADISAPNDSYAVRFEIR
jgi:anti-sigma-K factor RskA